jgi:hypothetical protein
LQKIYRRKLPLLELLQNLVGAKIGQSGEWVNK